MEGLLVEEHLLKEQRLEAVKKRLRTYSSIIDSNLMSVASKGKFYLDCREQINMYAVPVEDVYASDLPLSSKYLYRFLLNDEPLSYDSLEGEAYFFKGDESFGNRGKYLASSCELYLLARKIIDSFFVNNPFDETTLFKISCLKATFFEVVHYQKEFSSAIEIESLIYKLFNYFINDRSFNRFVSGLNFSTKSSLEKKQYNHISYLPSKSFNYIQSNNMIEEYFEFRTSNNYKTLHCGEVKNCRSLLDKSLYSEVLQKIKEMGLRTQSFEIQSALCAYLNLYLDEKKVETLTVYFPQGAAEEYLLGLFRSSGVGTVFVPHGLPQVSANTADFDYVLSLTMSDDWRALYPNSHIVHLGWIEQAGGGINKRKYRSSERLKIQFISQLTGVIIHRLDDFRIIADFFIREALKLPVDRYEVDIRLRNEDEMEIIDKDLISKVKSRKNMYFTLMSSGLMSESDADLIVGSTSTALLYSQFLRVPSLQLTTKRLVQHWPYRLASRNNTYILGDCRSFSVFLEKKISRDFDKMLYMEVDKEVRFNFLDHVYGFSDI